MKTSISLNGTWQLAGFENDTANWALPDSTLPQGALVLEGHVPGEVHPDLLRAGLIPDPYYGTNAEQLGWVAEWYWRYRRAIDVPNGFRQKRVFLEFDGLGTFARVYLNGTEVGSSQSGFIPHRLDVTEHIREGENVIAIGFEPAEQIGAGIPRDARLVSYGDVSIAELSVKPEIEGGYANAWVSLGVENHTLEVRRVMASVVVALGENRERVELVESIPPGGGTIEAVVRIEQPQLWWPNGFGEQTLYTCMAGIQSGDEIQDVAETRFGVREVTLAEQDDADNAAPKLLVNEHEILCKGANWIPPDCFISNVDPARYRELVRRAAEANLNLLRVGGEGVCESEAFCQACDEMGIVIWRGGAPTSDSAQGPPVIESVREFIPPEALWPPTNEVWAFHNADHPCSGSGDGLSRQQALERVTRSKMGDYETPEQFAAYAGILQGELLKTEIERRRRERSQTRGAMLGRFNDSWPAVTSSIIDYFMRPKIAYYCVKRACAPVIVSFKQANDRAQVCVTSDDRLKDVDGTLVVGVYTFETCGFDAAEASVSVPANASQAVWESAPFAELFLEPSRQCLVAFLNVGGRQIARNAHFPFSLREMEFPQPKLFVQREQVGENSLVLHVSADDYARNVAITNLPDGARLSDNYFDLIPGEIARIRIDDVTTQQASGLAINVWRA